MTVEEFLKLRPGVDRVKLTVSGIEYILEDVQIVSESGSYQFQMTIHADGGPSLVTPRIDIYDVIWGAEPDGKGPSGEPKYELVEYTDENPIQVGDEVNVAGTWMVVSGIQTTTLRVHDIEWRCQDISKSFIKQGRRPIKKEIVSGVKVCEITKDEFGQHGYLLNNSGAPVRNYLKPGKTYFLIEKEDGE